MTLRSSDAVATGKSKSKRRRNSNRLGTVPETGPARDDLRWGAAEALPLPWGLSGKGQPTRAAAAAFEKLQLMDGVFD